MEILIWVFFIFEAIVGAGSSIGIIVLLFGTIGYKVMRKIKYGTSLYD